MIAKIAVSAATYAIDKPYSYKIPEGMTLQPGQRVQLPFGRANKRTEGVVLTVETGNEEKLKAVERCLEAHHRRPGPGAGAGRDGHPAGPLDAGAVFLHLL